MFRESAEAIAPETNSQESENGLQELQALLKQKPLELNIDILKKYQKIISNPDHYPQLTVELSDDLSGKKYPQHLLTYFVFLFLKSKKQEQKIKLCLFFLIKDCNIDPDCECTYLFLRGEKKPISHLKRACLTENIKLLEIFLEANPNLIKKEDETKQNLLFFADSPKVVELLISAARKIGYSQTLLTQRDADGIDLITYYFNKSQQIEAAGKARKTRELRKIEEDWQAWQTWATKEMAEAQQVSQDCEAQSAEESQEAWKDRIDHERQEAQKVLEECKTVIDQKAAEVQEALAVCEARMAQEPEKVREEQEKKTVESILEQIVQLMCADYFFQPKNSKNYYDLLVKTQAFFSRPVPPIPSDDHVSGTLEENFSGFYQDVFNDEKIPKTPSECLKDKNSALKRIYIEFFWLLQNPRDCYPYFKKIDKWLNLYFLLKHKSEFPELPPETYKFIYIHGLEYPISTDQYTPIKLHSALQEVLSLFLKQHGFTGDFVKWIGFVPEEIANESIMKGYLPIEGNFVGALPHGNISHLMQFALCALAIQDGKIDVSYEENGEIKKLTTFEIIKNIFSAQKLLGAEVSLWGRFLFDRLDNDFMSFNDPFQLSSFLMRDPNHSFRILSDAMKSSFLKRFKRTVPLHNEIYSGNPLSDDEYVKLFNIFIIHGTVPFSPEFIEQLQRQDEEKTGKYMPYISDISWWPAPSPTDYDRFAVFIKKGPDFLLPPDFFNKLTLG